MTIYRKGDLVQFAYEKGKYMKGVVLEDSWEDNPNIEIFFSGSNVPEPFTCKFKKLAVERL